MLGTDCHELIVRPLVKGTSGVFDDLPSAPLSLTAHVVAQVLWASFKNQTIPRTDSRATELNLTGTAPYALDLPPSPSPFPSVRPRDAAAQAKHSAALPRGRALGTSLAELLAQGTRPQSTRPTPSMCSTVCGTRRWGARWREPRAGCRRLVPYLAALTRFIARRSHQQQPTHPSGLRSCGHRFESSVLASL